MADTRTAADRPGKARRKPNRAELAERIDAARDLLGRGLTDGQVKRGLAGRFGCSPRTVERYLRRPREAMVAERSGGITEMRAGVAEFYARMAADPDAPHAVRLKAMEATAKLYGLNAPARVEIMEPEMTEEQLRREEARLGLRVGPIDAGDLADDSIRAAAEELDPGVHDRLAAAA